MRKSIISFLLALILTVSILSVSAFAIVEQSEEYYVNDAAGVLSENLEKDIIAVNGGLENYCDGAQIVVVTVEYLDGMYSDEYAMQLFNSWGVGNNDKNNGMLLLLATEEKKAWLTVGAGISDLFTNNMVEDYFNDYFWDEFDAGNYEQAVVNFFPQLVLWYEGEYGTDFFSSYYESQSSQQEYYGDQYSISYPSHYYYGYNSFEPYMSTGARIMSILSRLFMIIVVIIVIVLYVYADRRRYRAYYTHMGMPIPPYHFWFLWTGPHRHWRGPRGPHGPGPGPGPGSGSGGFGGSGFRGGGFGSGGFGSGGFGGGFRGGGFGGGGFGGGGGGRR